MVVIAKAYHIGTYYYYDYGIQYSHAKDWYFNRAVCNCKTAVSQSDIKISVILLQLF